MITPAYTGQLREVARDIKLSHTVFALPFALLAMVLAADSAGRLPTAGQVGLILLCMVLARTVAMAINRWADADFDAANPRTANRAVPGGRVSRRFMLGVALVCSVGFILAAGGFYLLDANPWPGLLSPLVLLYLACYAYTKRFTALCHLYLGTALALSPLAAAIAIEPGYLAEPGPWLLAALVATWVAGFDVLYALQDVAVDQELGLHSLPARLGSDRALWVSRGLHALTLVALLALLPQLGTAFLIAACLTAFLLAWEHALVWRSHTHHLHLAFFTINGLISLLLGAAGIFDTLL